MNLSIFHLFFFMVKTPSFENSSKTLWGVCSCAIHREALGLHLGIILKEYHHDQATEKQKYASGREGGTEDGGQILGLGARNLGSALKTVSVP